jgi:hypothetical protein
MGYWEYLVSMLTSSIAINAYSVIIAVSMMGLIYLAILISKRKTTMICISALVILAIIEFFLISYNGYLTTL